MNCVVLIGRLVRDPETRRGNDSVVTRYTLAVDRFGKDKEADFISCVCFGKGAEFAEKYLAKGTKIGVRGRLRSGSYEKDGRRVYTTDVVVDEHTFCEKKGEASEKPPGNDWMDVPDGIQEELPFI